MMQSKTLQRAIWLLAASLLLAGCGAPLFKPADRINADNALLYLYRPTPDSFVVKPLLFNYPEVFIDDRSVGLLKNNEYLVVELAPGKHDLRITGLTENAAWEPRDIKQPIWVESGENKFVKLRVAYRNEQMTLTSPSAKYQINLQSVREEDAIYEIRHTERADD